MVAENRFPLQTNLPEPTLATEGRATECWWEQDTALIQLACPTCHQTYQPSALVCPACGKSFAPQTKPFESPAVEVTVTPKSDLDLEPVLTPIVCEINGKQMTLPLSNSLVIGRSTMVAGDGCPDVGLNDFCAAQHGVSRQHIRIIRKRYIVYVSDLNSSNGTLLNGRPLPRNCYRALNSGDELQLGLLKLTLKF